MDKTIGIVRVPEIRKIETSGWQSLLGTSWVGKRCTYVYKATNVSTRVVGPIIAQQAFPMVSKLDRDKVKLENLGADDMAKFPEGNNPGDICRWDIDSLEPGQEVVMHVSYDLSWDGRLVQSVISSLVDPAVLKRG